MDNTKTNYWVITSTEQALGPFDDYDTAYEYAATTLGEKGWTVTTTG